MKVIPNKMKFQCVELDRETAQTLLDKNHPRNRRIKEGRINQYTRDMNNKMWDLTWEPIVTDEDGWTVEGQNRLIAFLRSNQETIPITLCTGAPRKAMIGAGCGASRNVADVARILGQPFPHESGTYGGIARRMMLSTQRERNYVSIPETLKFIRKHRDAMEFAYECFGLKKIRAITQAAVLAVVARASYRHGVKTRLKEFAQVLISGLPENPKEDAAAIRLRNFLMDQVQGGRARQSRGTMRVSSTEVYARTETAVKHFLAREDVERLVGSRQELFPIPGDEVKDEPDEDPKEAA